MELTCRIATLILLCYVLVPGNWEAADKTPEFWLLMNSAWNSLKAVFPKFTSAVDWGWSRF